MTSVAEIQKEILELPEADYVELRRWFSQRDWEKWNLELEEDAASGKLDFLKAAAEEAKRNGTLGQL